MILLSFFICIIFVVYVYLGYPLLLWLATKNSKKNYPEKVYMGDISIIMVVCNESMNIREKLINIKKLNYSGGNINIIIVDDASTDDTCQFIENSELDIQLIKNDIRKGKANGINLAMAGVKTELAMLIDCRQELELNVIEYLSSWFSESDKVGAISGELILKPDDNNDFSAGMDGYWRYEKFIRKSEAKLSSVPGVTGALYMLRVKTFIPIPVDTLLDDVQIPMMSCAQGYHVGYDDRALAWDVPSTSVIKERARKIRTLSGNYQLLFRFPSWIVPGGHPIWWQFFSHKIARLLAPFVIVLSAFLAFKLYTSGNNIAGIYLALMLIALSVIPLGQAFPFLMRNKQLKLIQSFILLNWFCFLAFRSYFFTHQSGSWKNEA
jgi:cellulose synthase/poly-beta-1,6-N-acetylglucosamine synthase-like glycosyltransferase